MREPFPELREGEVHVWQRRVAELTDRADLTDLLNADERARAARYKFEKPRQQFTTARSTLRELLGSYLDCDPRAVEFDYAEHGKPSLAGSAEQLQFNVSHAHERVLLAFTEAGPVGVDIEWRDRKVEADNLARRFFSTAENDQLEGLSGHAQHQAFFRCWTQKEAYLKGLGSGLSRDTRSFTVDCAENAAGLLADEHEPDAPRAWSLSRLSLDEEYYAALAVRNRTTTVRTFELP